MGRVTQSGSDGTKGQRKSNIREEQRVRTKKKRRKKDLIDLHCGLRKPVKGKETKIDGNLGKARNSKKISNRILPRALSGIYRNGAIGKEIRRAQPHIALDDSNNARLEANVTKLLHGYDTNAHSIVINDNREQPEDLQLGPTARNILHPTPPCVYPPSPILGKVDGTKRHVRGEQEGHVGPSKCPEEKKKTANAQSSQESAIGQYEELCAAISAEFEGLNIPEQLTADPLSSVKKKLRSFYAESFHNQFLKDMIKRGQILSERNTPSSRSTNPLLPKAVYSTSGYGESPGLIAATVDSSNPHDIYKKTTKQVDSQANQNLIVPSKAIQREKRKEVPAPNLLFDFSVLNERTVDKVESEHHTCSGDTYFVGSVPNTTSLEKCCESQECLDNEALARIDRPDMKRDRKSLLFSRSMEEMLRESMSKKHLVKRKNQRTQTTNSLNNRARRHPGKGNAKATHQVNAKNLKHVPAILRRCNKVNLFDPPTKETIESPKQSVSITPLCIPLKSDTVCSSDTSVLNVQTCVVASPSIRKDLGKNPEGDPDSSGINAFHKKIKRVPMIHKTLMFTKKDTRNRRAHLNDLVAERSVDSSNVCLMRQEALQQQEKCGDCQRAASSCYQSFYYSENSEDSNYYSQELKEISVPQVRPLQVQQDSVACEEVFVRKLQHPGKNHTICFVAVDRGKELNGVQDCGKVPPEKVYCQDNVADVGILKGVQNMKILPMEDQRAKCATQCMANTVILEEQPVKYLAFDNDSETQKIPIYVQSKQRPQFTSVENADANPKVNYRLVPCPAEPAQKILLVPSHEQNKVMYVKEKSLHRPGVSYERVNQPRKMFFYRPRTQSDVQCEKNSNICEVHVSKQNLMEITNAGYENISGLQQTELGTKMRKSFGNWEEVHCRPSHEHTIVKDACAKTVYFKK